MANEIELMIKIGGAAVLLILGFTVGAMRERAHLRSLAKRESELTIGVVNLRRVQQPETVVSAQLVCGDAAIASDYLKRAVAGFMMIVGGELRSYERLMERARREALLRMLAEAQALGAHEVWNVRYESANITVGEGSGKRGTASATVFAYGTAIVRR